MLEATEPGLLRAFLLEDSGWRRVGWTEVKAWTPDHGLLWAHLDSDDVATGEWLCSSSGLDAHACERLLQGATRPQRRSACGGLLVTLRGVNLNPGADPEDMVSLRLWVDGRRMLSFSRRRLMATADLAADVERGDAPLTTPRLFTALVAHLLERMVPTLEDLDERVDLQEERVVSDAPRELQAELAELRRQVIALRRHLAPQREVLNQLVGEELVAADEVARGTLHGLADQLTRHVEDLEELRDRLAVTQDQLAGRQADTMNQRMFILSVVAGIFLPLGLITGLLGINVGGIPGASNEWGFAWTCGILGALLVVQLLVLRRWRWF